MTTEKQPSSIEKIRAEVEGIRKEHSGGQDAYPFQERMICHDCHQLWPCEALRLAEDKLRLAEALEAFEQWQGQVIPVYNDEFFHASDVREHVQKALSEVAR